MRNFIFTTLLIGFINSGNCQISLENKYILRDLFWNMEFQITKEKALDFIFQKEKVFFNFGKSSINENYFCSCYSNKYLTLNDKPYNHMVFYIYFKDGKSYARAINITADGSLDNINKIKELVEKISYKYVEVEPKNELDNLLHPNNQSKEIKYFATSTSKYAFFTISYKMSCNDKGDIYDIDVMFDLDERGL